jgi:glycosyltransferase involved in cell wall biosynthesis
MRLLFVKEELTWPRKSGHDVHTYYMMRGLIALGHQVGLITRASCSPEALAGLALDHCGTFQEAPAPRGRVRLSWLQDRFRSYWGQSLADIEAVDALAADFRPDVLVAVGLEALPYMAAAGDTKAVWYAADEWFLHHLSLVELASPATWRELRNGAIKLLYERAFAPRIARAWVVSEPDRRAMRYLAGVAAVDVLPNGVDAEFFAPADVPSQPSSCVFWGRLDFEPNIQALQWFIRNVWPLVLVKHPEAALRIVGSSPVAEVQRLQDIQGVTLYADVPDIREYLHPMEVAVMPFVGGAGIKNKILEASALGKAVLCTRRARGGLRGEPPFATAESGAEWADELSRLWRDAPRRKELGAAARAWVMQNHSWDTTARAAVAALVE